MNFSPAHDDAAYLRLVHELLQLQPESAELRRNSRQPFPTHQSVASYSGTGLPKPADFERVRCFDLSTTGFSFLRNESFSERQLVVALGAAPDVVHLTAEVMHETSFVLVGCRFTGRIEQPSR